MYGPLWRRLPGTTAVKAVIALLLAVLVAGLLWYVVFPWLEPLIALDEGTLGR